MANNRIAYGLLKKLGYETDGMTPEQAWKALDGVPIEKLQAALRQDAAEVSSLPSARKIADSIPQGAWDNLASTEMNKEPQRKAQSDENVVKINLDAEIQKQFDNATPKERQKIAYRYIMDHLAGKYTARDGREVSISSVGADKITHRNIDIKLRVSPALALLIQTGELVNVVDVEHKRFEKMAYYKTTFQIGQDVFVGLLNVGIRHNGESTLYDLNPFNKQ